MKSESELEGLRKQIDVVDAELAEVLSRRQQLVEQVLVLKKQHGIPARVQERIDAVIDNAAQRGLQSGLNPDLARTVWTAMVEWFVRHEERELGKS